MSRGLSTPSLAPDALTFTPNAFLPHLLSFFPVLLSQNYYEYNEACFHCSEDPTVAFFVLGVVLALALLLAFVLFRYREQIKSTSGVGSTVKILLAFCQIVWSMQEVFDLKFPPAFKWFVRYVMSWFSLQFLNALVGLECVFHNTYFDNLALKTTVPIVFTVMLLLAVAKSWASMASGHKTQERHNKTKDICLTIFLWMTFLILPSISSDLFLLFSCESFDDGSIQLKSSYDISCSSSQYQQFAIFAAFMIVLYPVRHTEPHMLELLSLAHCYALWKIGIPWFQFFVLFRCRDRLDPAKSSSFPMEEEDAIKRRDEDPRNHRFMFLVEM